MKFGEVFCTSGESNLRYVLTIAVACRLRLTDEVNPITHTARRFKRHFHGEVREDIVHSRRFEGFRPLSEGIFLTQ